MGGHSISANEGNLPTETLRTIVYIPTTQKEWIKRLQGAGWTLERGGKHQAKVTKAGRRPVTLPENKRHVYSKSLRRSYAVRRESMTSGVDSISMMGSAMPEPQQLHVNVRLEGESVWATVDEFPGVFATGDNLGELRESLQEGIALVLAKPGEEPPTVILAPLKPEPVLTKASSELVYA